MDQTSVPAAGWYPDPWREAPHRWWNGIEWTAELRRPDPVAVPVPAAVPPLSPVPASPVVDDAVLSAVRLTGVGLAIVGVDKVIHTVIWVGWRFQAFDVLPIVVGLIIAACGAAATLRRPGPTAAVAAAFIGAPAAVYQIVRVIVDLDQESLPVGSVIDHTAIAVGVVITVIGLVRLFARLAPPVRPTPSVAVVSAACAGLIASLGIVDRYVDVSFLTPPEDTRPFQGSMYGAIFRFGDVMTAPALYVLLLLGALMPLAMAYRSRSSAGPSIAMGLVVLVVAIEYPWFASVMNNPDLHAMRTALLAPAALVAALVAVAVTRHSAVQR